LSDYFLKNYDDDDDNNRNKHAHCWNMNTKLHSFMNKVSGVSFKMKDGLA